MREDNLNVLYNSLHVLCILLVGSMLVAIPSKSLSAQDTSRVFKEGDILLQFNLGILGRDYDKNSESDVVESIVIEIGISDEWSIGLVGTRIYGGTTNVYTSNGEIIMSTHTPHRYWLIGYSMAYHLSSDLLNDFGIPSNRVDVTGRFFIGPKIGNTGYSLNVNSFNVGIGYGLYGGGTYYFAPHFGAQVELGYGTISHIRFGLVLKI